VKGKRRHVFGYFMAWIIFKLFFIRKFNYKYEKIKVDYSPYIVISNHLTNWDPLLIGMSFKKSMYYVATDQILRMGIKSKLLMFFLAPITRAKTAQEVQTVIEIFKHLREKCNVCIFAEGNTSFDGETGEVQQATGKLVKKAGAALVTYRFTGSYLTFPRWARFIRRGKMEGRLVKIYSPDEIAAMSEEEIYMAIKKDIYVNAYSEQEKNMTAYRGKRPAEYLETVLYCCPKCKKFAVLKSSDNEFFCECGFKVIYNEFGYFKTPEKNGEPPFKTIFDWAKWQRNEIKELAATLHNIDSNTAIFTDENQKLFEIEKSINSSLIAKGKLCLYKDRLALIADDGAAIGFPLESIIEMSVFAKTTIIFSTKINKTFEIHSEKPRSALKYLDLIREINYIARE